MLNAVHLLHTVAGQHRLLPPLKVGILGDTPWYRSSTHKVIDVDVPNHEREVGVGALVAHKPVSAAERVVEHPDDALDLIIVAGLCGLDLLWVMEVEPIFRMF